MPNICDPTGVDIVSYTQNMYYGLIIEFATSVEAQKEQPCKGDMHGCFICAMMCGLLHGCYTGEHLAFDGFEEGTAACADVAYLVGKTELVDTSH